MVNSYPAREMATKKYEGLLSPASAISTLRTASIMESTGPPLTDLLAEDYALGDGKESSTLYG